MNSTQMREEIAAVLAECEADKSSVCMSDTDSYIEKVLDSIIFHCLGMKEEVEAIRNSHLSFFSHFSHAEKEAVRKVDEEVWGTMDSIWLVEQSWCCDSDFEDDVQDWLYVEEIYEDLIEIIEYAEEKYGVFQIIETK